MCVCSYLCLKTLTEDFLNFLSSILQSVCLHPVLSCDYASCTLCLSSFHHDDYACILLSLLLSTYSAASSSSLRNFLTGKFLSEEFQKNRLFTPPLVDITHFQRLGMTQKSVSRQRGSGVLGNVVHPYREENIYR